MFSFKLLLQFTHLPQRTLLHNFNLAKIHPHQGYVTPPSHQTRDTNSGESLLLLFSLANFHNHSSHTYKLRHAIPYRSTNVCGVTQDVFLIVHGKIVSANIFGELNRSCQMTRIIQQYPSVHPSRPSWLTGPWTLRSGRFPDWRGEGYPLSIALHCRSRISMYNGRSGRTTGCIHMAARAQDRISRYAHLIRVRNAASPGLPLYR